MGDLIGRNVADMFVGGTGVIDLIKISGVQIGNLVRHGFLLVKKGVRTG
ncbi:hypothetical protein SDC9_156750 [bioreactor metagenome]|uniref:Uncharacterized protein n=1 Tax=bioreactor metagenome TaxID=1076179 RepID=A0A645F6F6_9ZZZZ